jgi:hypothetical protein
MAEKKEINAGGQNISNSLFYFYFEKSIKREFKHQEP